VAREDAEDLALVLRELLGRLAAELLELVAEEGGDAREAEVGEAWAGVEEPDDGLVVLSVHGDKIQDWGDTRYKR
jgi:hypothetical protein